MCIFISEYDHICDDLKHVDETLQSLEIDSEEYVVMFNSSKNGKRQCRKTAKYLEKLSKRSTTINATVHSKTCEEKEKILLCTLNFEGLKWVRIGNVKANKTTSLQKVA